MNNPYHRRLISDSDDFTDFLLEHRQRLAAMVATHLTCPGYMAPVPHTKQNLPIANREINHHSNNGDESLAA